MAIMRPITEQPASMKERTWRTNIETPSTAPYSIQFYRETIPVDADENPVGKAVQEQIGVNRLFDAVAEETVEIATGRVTFLDLIDGLSQFADRWADEEYNKPPIDPNPIEPTP